MRKKWKRDEWNHIDDVEIEDKPIVNEIILPTFLYKYAIERGRETYKEVGFYLIGFFKKGICYVHDLIEFEYSEQSGGFIESGMARYLRIKAGLPIGLKIVGHMHKHPGFTQYSSTDKRNFLRYGNSNPFNAFLIYIVEPYEKISGYTATSEGIYSVEVSIRDLKDEEMLMEKDLKIQFTTKAVLPKDSNQTDFNLIFSENIGSESLKFLSRPVIEVDNKQFEKDGSISEKAKISVIPRKPIEIEDIGKSGIRYRIFMEGNETIADLEKILRRLTYIPQQKGYDIRFFEEGKILQNDLKVENIEHPLIWTYTKSVILPIYQKFYHFWKDFFKLIDKKISVKVEKRPYESYPEKSRRKTAEITTNSELETVFKNFHGFWVQILKIFESKELKQEVKSEKMDISESEPAKKRREFKRYELDYYI